MGLRICVAVNGLAGIREDLRGRGERIHAVDGPLTKSRSTVHDLFQCTLKSYFLPAVLCSERHVLARRQHDLVRL